MKERNMWIVETTPDWDIFAMFGEYKMFHSHKEASSFYRYCVRKEGKENVSMKRIREIVRESLPETPAPISEVNDLWEEWDGEIDFPF